LTLLIADLIFDARTVEPSILMRFEAKMGELWMLESRGWSLLMLEIVIGSGADRLWGRDFYPF